MSKRHDIHRPSAINPTEYVFVGFEYVPMDDVGSAMFLNEQRSNIRAHMTRTGGTYSGHEHGGNCMVCGNANAIYTVLFHHEPTNTYVRMGNDCAQKCDVAFSNGDFDAFKIGMKNALDLQKGKRKAQAVLAEAGFSAAWPIYVAANGNTYNLPYEESTMVDIVGKLVQYGSVSDKSLKFVGNLLYKIEHRAEIAAQRQAATDAAAPVPAGRIDIEGIVLTLKHEDSPYGPVVKMLVQHDTGWKVWGTKPSKLIVNRGDRITFKATVTPSKQDIKFGYFSRPTGAEVTVSVISASGVPVSDDEHALAA